jgi:selenocysteine-specific elongation factor
LQSILRAGGLSPPDVAELCARLNAKSLLVLDLLRLLVDEGFATEVNPGLFLSVDADSELKRKAMDRLRESPGSMADLRDAWGTTRKYAVPYGEYLDRLGITRREGDIRVLVDEAIATALPSDRR